MTMGHPGELLSAYLDGELMHDERRAVLVHLDGCTPCRAELAELNDARTAVRALPMLEPPVLAAPAATPAATPAARVVPLRRRWSVRVAAVAAAAIVGVAGLGAVRGGSTSPALDIGSSIDQHVVRGSVDIPGLAGARSVAVVQRR